MATVTTIRDATVADAPVILQFIKELAEYEKEPDAVVTTVADLEHTLFCPNPKAFAVIVESDNKPVGFAVYFYNYSTWLGKHGMWIEDVYVQPEHRGGGIGRTVFQHLARRAVEQGCGRMEWWVLDWNEPAINFYRKIAAEPMSEWTVQRLSGDALQALANETSALRKAS